MQPSYSLPQLMVLADAWCEGTGSSVQLLDTLITDPKRERDSRKLFTRIKRDPSCSMTSRSMEKATRFFHDCWPWGVVEWPASVPYLGGDSRAA